MDFLRPRAAPPPPPPAAKPGLFLFDLDRLGTQPRHENEAIIRGLTSPVTLGGGTALCRVLGRYKAYVDTADIGLSAHLMLDGYWEMWVTEAIAAAARPGMHAVDLGANLGYFTLLLADLVGPTGQVTAVEANPRMVQLLRRSLLVNGFAGRVTLDPRAIHDESGLRVSLNVPPDHPQNAHLVEGAGDKAARTVTLDDLVGDAPVDLVKIDVEGSERRAWDGMRGVLARGAPLTVILEFNAPRYEDPAGFLAGIEAAGFSVRSIDPVRGVVPVAVDEILSRATLEDWMLILQR